MSDPNSDGLAESEGFWREALRGWGDCTRLPFCARQSPFGGMEGRPGRSASCSATVSTPSSVLAQDESSLEAAIAGAWALLLNRITGEEAVMFGLSVGGRSFPLIVETPDELISGVLVRSLSGRIARYAAQAAVGCSKIREWSQIKSGSPLFESIIAYEGLHVLDPAAVNCPLLVGAARSGATELRLDLHFEPELLPRDRALRLTMQLAKLVSALLNDPQCRLGELSVLTDCESNRLLVEWNRTELQFDERKCIHQLFEEQSVRTPGATAVVCRDQKLSYEELNQLAERLAAHLSSNLGVGPEAVVAICMEPSLNLTVALLGILKAGGAYLPVDPAFPAERVAFMLRDSKAMVIVTQPGLNGRFSESNARVVVLDDGCEFTAPAKVVESAVQAENLAYLMYTSGSTGTPKGVMVEHRNVVNFFAAMDHILGTGSGVWLAVTSISFDISVLELLWTLTRGFTVIVQAEEDKLIAQGRHSLAEQLGRHNVTHLQCTPTLARMLIRLPGALSAMKSVRQLLLGGEPLPPALAQQLSKELGAEIHNMYGPTETTVWSTTHRLSDSEQESIPIGRPIANTSIYIIDQHLRPVPIGSSGELYIGGKGVARGYWNRPELTAERFISNPFSGDPADRLYRTGDLARYRENGVIEFLGRVDHQVKIRGFRIELGEIESVLRNHPLVREVVVDTLESSSGHPQLVAYVVAADGQSRDDRVLQIYARQKLPAYMIPAAFVFVDRMPTTPNGKVDRKALAALAAARKSAIPNNSASATDLETVIARVWQEALGVDAVGLHENFFDLGANSLIVAEVAVSLREMCKLDVRLTDLFAYPTISALAAKLCTGRESRNAASEGAERGVQRRNALQHRAAPIREARKSSAV